MLLEQNPQSVEIPRGIKELFDRIMDKEHVKTIWDKINGDPQYASMFITTLNNYLNDNPDTLLVGHDPYTPLKVASEDAGYIYLLSRNQDS